MVVELKLFISLHCDSEQNSFLRIVRTSMLAVSLSSQKTSPPYSSNDDEVITSIIVFIITRYIKHFNYDKVLDFLIHVPEANFKFTNVAHA